jgi:tRNA(Ile)-lysidine synthase
MITIGPQSRPLDGAETDLLMRPFAPVEGLLVAVSGGADSMALLVLLSEWAHRQGVPMIAATVDHGLRPESRAEAGAVAATCGRLGVEHVVLDWTGARPETRIEEQARTARYGLLTDLARRRGLSHLATGHTMDDQAETVLLRLAAGTGLTGLAAMRDEVARSGIRHVRPFLNVPKNRLVATLEEGGCDWHEDPSNCDVRFARARLRQSRAVLEREGLSAERLAVLARRVARAENALARAAEEAWAGCATLGQGRIELNRAALLELPEEIALRLLVRALDEAGGGAAIRLARAEALLQGVLGALRARRSLARTLAGCAVRVGSGPVRIERAPPRSRRVPQG